jgi:hypothetical protein
MPPDPQRFLRDILANRYNRAILEAWDALQLEVQGAGEVGCATGTIPGRGE